MLIIKRLHIVNFKNFENELFEFGSGVNLIVGDNAMGKTNVLDSIYFLAFTKSYSNLTDAQLRRHQVGDYKIDAMLAYPGDQSDALIQAEYVAGVKKFLADRESYQKMSDHIGKIPLVYVFPQEIGIVYDDSSVRRKYVDQSIAQYDPKYLRVLSKYKKGLQQRNAVLKNNSASISYKHSMLDLIDMQLAELVPYIGQQREDFVSRLVELIDEEYQKIADSRDGSVGVMLKSNYPLDAQGYTDILAEKRRYDIDAQRSSIGPHRDDLLFRINGYLLKKYGSQGQIKSFLIALKLAHFQVFSHKLQDSPVLLLDDIFDKLDESRIQNVLQNVFAKKFGQVFITTTSDRIIGEILRGMGIDFRTFRIKEGKIQHEKEEK